MGTSIFSYTLAWNKFSERKRKLEEAIDSVPIPDIKKGCNNLCYNLFLWTSLGLNQGPPDYESFCVVFHVITWDVNMLIISDYWILWFAGKYVHLR